MALFCFPDLGGIIIIRIISLYVANSTILIIITLCNFMCLREAGRRKESNYMPITFDILALLFPAFCSLHLFLWTQVTTWHHFLNPRQICFYLPLLWCYWQISYISNVIGPDSTVTYVLFHALAF